MRASGHLRFYLAAETQIASKISVSPSRTGITDSPRDESAQLADWQPAPRESRRSPRMLDLYSDNANIVIESVLLGKVADVIENTRVEFLRRKRRVTVHGSVELFLAKYISGLVFYFEQPVGMIRSPFAMDRMKVL